MQLSVSPLHRQPRGRLLSWQSVKPLLFALLLGAFLFALSSESALARVAAQRDRRSDREVTVPYRRASITHRQNSGFVERDRPDISANGRSSANSGASEQGPSNRNDESAPLRDTDRRLRR